MAFKEQIQFLQAKVNTPTRSWTDVWRDSHDSAFMVAGAYKAELLSDLRGAVTKAIAEGRSLESFRSDFDQLVQKHGWSYNGSREWRTRLIYETNMRTSYQAGRYAQLTYPPFLAAYPFWRYHHSDAVKHPRPMHLALNGKVIAAADSWWITWYPPNGWGCKCTVFAESHRTLARKGLKVSQAPPIEMERVIVGKNSGSPRIVWVAKGIDPGWDYAPGATRASQVRDAIEKAKPGLPPQLQLDLQKTIDHIPKAPPAPEPPAPVPAKEPSAAEPEATRLPPVAPIAPPAPAPANLSPARAKALPASATPSVQEASANLLRQTIKHLVDAQSVATAGTEEAAATQLLTIVGFSAAPADAGTLLTPVLSAAVIRARLKKAAQLKKQGWSTQRIIHEGFGGGE